MYNLNYAFEVAEQHLDIPKMLDAEGNTKTQKDFYYYKYKKIGRIYIKFFKIPNI